MNIDIADSHQDIIISSFSQLSHRKNEDDKFYLSQLILLEFLPPTIIAWYNLKPHLHI